MDLFHLNSSEAQLFKVPVCVQNTVNCTFLTKKTLRKANTKTNFLINNALVKFSNKQR